MPDQLGRSRRAPLRQGRTRSQRLSRDLHAGPRRDLAASLVGDAINRHQTVRTVPGQAEASAKLLPRPPQGEQQTLPGDDLQLAPLKTDLTCRLIGHGAKLNALRQFCLNTSILIRLKS